MTEPTIESAPVSTGVVVTVSEDGNYVGMTFGTMGEPVKISFPAQNIGHMIARLIGVTEGEAAKSVTTFSRGEVTSVPISVAGLGVARGRSETEALLSIRTGPMTLTFAVDLPTLHGMCENLRRMTRETGQPPTSH